MVSELQDLVNKDKVLFGIRECLKHGNKITKVFAPTDSRTETLRELEKEGIKVEMLELDKIELAEKLEIGFACEVFGVRK